MGSRWGEWAELARDVARATGRAWAEFGAQVASLSVYVGLVVVASAIRSLWGL
jgi:hypothetical protein